MEPYAYISIGWDTFVYVFLISLVLYINYKINYISLYIVIIFYYNIIIYNDTITNELSYHNLSYHNDNIFVINIIIIFYYTLHVFKKYSWMRESVYHVFLSVVFRVSISQIYQLVLCE